MTKVCGILGKKRQTRRVWIGYWALIFIATHVPIPAGSAPSVPYLDKVVHFLFYFGLAFLGGRVQSLSRKGIPFVVLVLWAVIYLGYGAMDEWLQQFVDRTMSLNDWLADMAGVVTATLLLAWRGGAPLSGKFNASGNGSSHTTQTQ